MPPSFAAVVRRCLQKRPEARFQSAADLAFAVATLAAGSDALAGGSAPAAAARVHWRAGVPTAALVGLAVLAVAGTGTWQACSAPGCDATNLAARRTQSLTELVGLEEAPAIAPDGKSVAFVAMIGGHRQVFVRLLAGGVALQITREPLEHLFPRWSPDSSSIVYFSPAGARGVARHAPGGLGARRRFAPLVGAPRRWRCQPPGRAPGVFPPALTAASNW